MMWKEQKKVYKNIQVFFILVSTWTWHTMMQQYEDQEDLIMFLNPFMTSHFAGEKIRFNMYVQVSI